jgi:hypothetical protein
MGVHGKRVMHAHLVDATPEVGAHQRFGRVLELRGKGVVAVAVAAADGAAYSGHDAWRVTAALAMLPPRFRSVLYLRRGASVILGPASSETKVAWNIDAVLRPEDVRAYILAGVWPPMWLPSHRRAPTDPAPDDASSAADQPESD